jgi:hypothetical protein
MKSPGLRALLSAIVAAAALVVGGCGSSSGGADGSSGSGGTSVTDGASGAGGGAMSMDGADAQASETTPPSRPTCAQKDGTSCTGTVEFCQGDLDSAPCNCKDGKWACHPFCGSTCAAAGTNGQCYDADPTVDPVPCSCKAADSRSAWTCG